MKTHEDKRTVIVTGATRGIGKAITEKFLTLGYRVIGLYATSASDANKLQDEHSDLTMKCVDLSDSKEIYSFVESMKDVKIHALVNNAGCFEEEDIDNYDLGSWHKSIATNVTGQSN